jgi:D-alanyl-lipoteichoic acid acyltransferase DltB (MBOAT superfamily)
MLFNSLIFLLLFLPVVFAGYRLLLRLQRPWVVLSWLTAASLCFYGAWNPAFVLLLLAHIAMNGLVARALPHRGVFALGVVLNLVVLGVFKYADFFIGSANQVLGTDWSNLGWVLPVGISFFTFTQLAFLADVQSGQRVDRSALRYVLFVTWFPHLVAGPVIHHAQVMPQLERAARHPPRALAVQAGFALFVLGLSKKLLVADPLALYASPVFDAAARGQALDILSAWSGVLAYTLQLYFDFSGYSDMACGLSLMFGVRLPLNFYSPYKAVGIIEFWRRWHITLSRFLRDYLYIPLGGNQRGPWRRHLNVLATMLLGGLWHGASWNFVLWGAVHGALLVAHQAWRRWSPWRLPTWGAVLMTFILVALAWIPFRAADLPSAMRLWDALWQPSSFVGWVAVWQQVQGVWMALGSLGSAIDWIANSGPAAVHVLARGAAVPFLVVGLLIVWWAPNTAQIMGPLVDDKPRGRARLRWRPRPTWAVALGLLLGLCLLNIDRQSPFLYFQF